VKTQDARNAIEALLAGKEVSVKHTGVFGCSTKWQEKQSSRIEALKKLDANPVVLELTSADDLKKLCTNPTGKMTLASFWATWCGSCVHEFADLEDTYRMYSVRDLRYVTVSTNMPDEKESVLRMLKNMHSTSSNLLFASEDTAALEAAFDPKWESTVP
jgi:thiol-disulfide isomerase/thioredoxin